MSLLKENIKEQNKNIYLSKVFILTLLIKMIFSFYFASHYMTQLFAPFINWFVISGFKDSWDFFYSLHQLKMFPYPTVMLWIMALPRVLFNNLLSNNWQDITHLHLFVMRIPLLIFDIFILNLLLKIFPTKKETVLYVYWCSPIVFFINYIHGQLDIIPTGIFLAAIYLLINKKYLYSIIFMAISAACKSHIFIALPFYFLFLYRQRINLIKVLVYFLLFGILYVLLLSPYINSKAFLQMVFNNAEQKGIYEFGLPLSPSIKIILCPTAIFLLFLKFTSYNKLNKEILLMFLGLCFAIFIVFINPMPGRAIWSLPFIIYFYISNKEYSKIPFVFYNFIYVIYFLLFFENDYFLKTKTLQLTLINNISISLLISSVAFIVVWMYQIGIKRNEELKIKEKPLLIGIGGDSSTGKHTTFKVLEKLLGKDSCVPVFGDDFHKWERSNENWKIFTHLNPLSNKLHKELESAIALKGGNEIEIGQYDHSQGKFKNPALVEPNKFILFIGLHPFYLKSMREFLDIKIFMDADEELRQYWKIKRDIEERGYEKSQVLEQINSRLEDSNKFIKPQKDFADLIIKLTPLKNIDPENPTGKTMPIKTTYILDNSINLEDLLSNLTKINTLIIEHSNLHDLTHQKLDIEGFISLQEITNIAYNLELNFDELLISNPDWLNNHAGITQLIFTLIYNHKMKAK